MKTTARAALPAPRYQVSPEWEHNEYQDSDFYVVVYNPNTGGLGRELTGTTRFASISQPGVSHFVPLGQTPPEIFEQAERALASMLANWIRNGDQHAVAKPQPHDAKHGVRLRLTRDVRTKANGVLPAGTVGEVYWSGSRGTFYKRGYNQPNRSNTRVGLRLRDGRRVFVTLEACQLDREPLTEEQITERAGAIAARRDFYSAFATSAISLV